MRFRPLAAGDLPLPTAIPPWMGVAIIGFWVAVVWLAVQLMRWRRAIRADRLAILASRANRPDRRSDREPDRPELEPPANSLQ